MYDARNVALPHHRRTPIPNPSPRGRGFVVPVTRMEERLVHLGIEEHEPLSEIDTVFIDIGSGYGAWFCQIRRVVKAKHLLRDWNKQNPMSDFITVPLVKMYHRCFAKMQRVGKGEDIAVVMLAMIG